MNSYSETRPGCVTGGLVMHSHLVELKVAACSTVGATLKKLLCSAPCSGLVKVSSDWKLTPNWKAGKAANRPLR